MPKLVDNKPSLKQQKWLLSYSKTGNSTLAAKEAGYQCNHEKSYGVIGCENLAKLKTWNLDSEQLSKESSNILSANEVLQQLSKLALKARKEETKTRNLEILAKYHGLLKDKVEQEITTKVAESSSSLDEQYKRLLNQSN